MSKIWFVTGASRGFGRLFVEAALARGDKVAATVRDVASIADLAERHPEDLLSQKLDVTDREADFAAVREAHARFGRLDVVVNNAGYGLFGAVEEMSEPDIRAQMEANFFGALWITQAAIPILREQGSGHIVQVSSVGGVAAFAGIGGYHASKWALEGLSESLAQELEPFGVKVTIVEPGPFRTDWGGSSAIRSDPRPAYDGLREAQAARRGGYTGGDPAAAAAALLKVVDADDPPLRVLFGNMAVDTTRAVYDARRATWDAWEQVSREADGFSRD